MSSIINSAKFQENLIAERQAKASREATEAARNTQRRTKAESHFQQQRDNAKAEARAKMEAKINASLAAEKETAKRAWLANHPDHTAEDFERRAWPQLKGNIMEARDKADTERAINNLRATDRYRL